MYCLYLLFNTVMLQLECIRYSVSTHICAHTLMSTYVCSRHNYISYMIYLRPFAFRSYVSQIKMLFVSFFLPRSKELVILYERSLNIFSKKNLKKSASLLINLKLLCS
uniref:Uncharacterized protein n=1 Tax=Cacopsylla melanoneura TaxID=428564 RepID=A0A8D8T4Z6_9HEMI